MACHAEAYRLFAVRVLTGPIEPVLRDCRARY